MATSTPSPLQIIREELPRFLDEPHAAEFKEVISSLVPTTPQDVALSALFGPARSLRAADAVERFEQEREYFPHRGATNYESRPEMYMRHAPDKIIPRREWPYGPEVGGVHNALEGIVVPSGSLRWLMPEVLAHESQHKIDAGLPDDDVMPQKRQQAEMSVRDRLMEMLSPLRPGDYPYGLTGRDKLGEMAPELVAAEGYLPAGQSLIHSELGKRIFQSPEEKLWYMLRRYPRMRDPEVKGGYLDAITSAAPR